MIDRDRIEELTRVIMEEIKSNYEFGPTSPDRAFEALNALAAATAIVLLGSDGFHGTAREFFNKALELAFNDMEQHFK